MSVKTYRITGNFKRKRRTQDFVKTIQAMKQEDAKELTLSTIGSQHHVKRFQIRIKNVEELEK